MYVCMHVCMHACMHVCMYVCMHACMHACLYVCSLKAAEARERRSVLVIRTVLGFGPHPGPAPGQVFLPLLRAVDLSMTALDFAFLPPPAGLCITASSVERIVSSDVEHTRVLDVRCRRAQSLRGACCGHMLLLRDTEICAVSRRQNARRVSFCAAESGGGTCRERAWPWPLTCKYTRENVHREREREREKT